MSVSTVPPVSPPGRPLAPYRVFDDRPFRADGALLALGFTVDGLLSSVEEPGILRRWDAGAGLQRQWHPLTELELIWAFDRSGRLVAGSSDDVEIWDVATGKLQVDWELPSWATALAFAPDGKLVATGHDDGVIRLWDVESGRLSRAIESQPRPISALAFSPEGNRLASAGEGKTIRLWNCATGRPIGSLQGHTDRIPALAWHPSGQRLYSAGWDTTARVWDLATFEPVILLNSHTGQVLTLAINHQGTLLACADGANRVHVWDLATNRTRHVLTGHEAEIRALAFSPDGTRLASAGDDRVIHLWDPATGQELLGGGAIRPQATPASPAAGFAVRTGVAVSSDGIHLASIGSTGLRVWDLASGQAVRQPEASSDLACVAYSPDGKWLAAGGSDARVRIWEAATGKIHATVEGQDLPLTALAFSPDGTTLAGSGSGGGDVWLWDVASGEPKLLIPDAVDGESVEALAFSPDGQWLAAAGIDWLATGGSDGALALWDVASNTRRPLLPGGSTALAFDPSGRRLAAPSLGRTVRVWDVAHGRLHLEMNDFSELVNAVAYSPDGKWLATGGDDHTLRLWHAHDLTLAGALELDSQIKSLRFAPDSRCVFTGNANTSAYQVSVEQILKG